MKKAVSRRQYLEYEYMKYCNKRGLVPRPTLSSILRSQWRKFKNWKIQIDWKELVVYIVALAAAGDFLLNLYKTLI